MKLDILAFGAHPRKMVIQDQSLLKPHHVLANMLPIPRPLKKRKPESKEVLRSFYKKIQPGGPGWSKIVKEAKIDNEELVLNSNKKWSCCILSL